MRAGLSELQELTDLIDETHSGPAAKKKTRTVLNRLWLEPRPDLIEFAERGIQLYRKAPDTPILALSWAMAITTYPFFGRVAEIVGRLTALQGDCASTEVHRRMAEAYGEREGTRRMTNMVIQTQESWGAIERAQKGETLGQTAEAVDTRGQICCLAGRSVCPLCAEAACGRVHGLQSSGLSVRVW